MAALRFSPAGPLAGRLQTAADKSISHRAALFAAMADGTSTIEGYLRAADTDSTLEAIRALGCTVDVDGSSVRVRGVGLRGARAADGVIDVGNSGTLMRLLTGWLAGQPTGSWTVDGDESIRRRPIDRVAGPLGLMGASIATTAGLPPFTVEGSHLIGADHRMAVASAQVKSAILMAGLLADSATSVTESPPSRDHTERMLAEQGARISIVDDRTARTVTVEPCERLEPTDRTVPGDPSSAAFLVAAALIVPGSDVTVENIDLNPGRIGLFRILERMGASIDGLPESEPDPLGPEPLGSIRVRHSALKAVEVGADEVPASIDELPLLALVACFAEGTTVVTGAEELRVKESDRIEATVTGLSGLGARIEESPDGFSIDGIGRIRGGSIDSHGDHRLAMLGAVAGLASTDGVEVGDFDAAKVSYPGFAADIASLA